jgi:hypothetical protein
VKTVSADRVGCQSWPGGHWPRRHNTHSLSSSNMIFVPRNAEHTLSTGHKVSLALYPDEKWHIRLVDRLRGFSAGIATFETSYPEPNGWDQISFDSPADAYAFLEQQVALR